MEREKVMTVQEYIDKNLPFYHITPAKNRDSILKDGLHKGVKYDAVCVVRSDDFSVLYDIASSQLSDLNAENEKFIVIRLLPSKHDIKAIDVAPDNVTDSTSPLHNYLVGKTFQITKEDIILEFTHDLPCMIKDAEIIKHLTEYKRGYRPDFRIL